MASASVLSLPLEVQDYLNRQGRVAVPAADVERRLGRVAWALWHVLLAHRGSRFVHLLRATATREVRRRLKDYVSERQVKRAQERLVQAGLVISHGRKILPVTQTTREGNIITIERKVLRAVPARTLYGFVDQGDESTLYVPNATARWLKEHRFRGGNNNPRGINKRPFCDPDLTKTEGAPVDKKVVESGPQGGGQIGVADRLLGPEDYRPVVPPLFSYGEKKPPDGGASLSSSTPDEGLEAATAPAIPSAPSEALADTERLRANGIIRNGFIPPAPGRGGVPSFPYGIVVEQPSPPRLPKDADEFDRVVLLLKAYKGALASRYKGKVWFNVPSIAEYKHFDLLAKFSQLLADHDIAPAAWAAWSLDVWRAHVEPTKKPRRKKKARAAAPPVTWVFSEERLTEHLRWFESEHGYYSGTHGVFVPAAQELIRRWDAFTLRLAWTRSQAEVDRLVENCWGGGRYDQLLNAAREQGAVKQAEIRRAVKRGEWMSHW